ncbi:MerC domain-containing protein [Flammeovirga sp. OC4]|uniref:MerC domain-containing protein n=1 Tax=Flammeovirga sp. OC4 TaxID=1382345 RepID=UPI00155DC96E|nr:MerC domain-containing protein [Flammeovirga sp. OC4]
MNLSTYKSDIFGAVTSFLCLIHCLITPFLFIADSCSIAAADSCCESSPSWWRQFDYLFLFISLIAVVQSYRSSRNNIVKFLFLFSWSSLSFVILNEKMQWLSLHENTILFPSIGLIVLHLYNQRDLKSRGEECCTV